MASKKTNETGLVNDKVLKFIYRYLETLNATQSYMEVYECSYDSAKANAYRLLAKDSTTKAINEIVSSQSSNVDVQEFELIAQLKNIMLSPNTANRDKLKAIELLGKYLNMWSNDVEVNVQPVINVSIVDDDNKDIVIDEPIDVDYDDID